MNGEGRSWLLRCEGSDHRLSFEPLDDILREVRVRMLAARALRVAALPEPAPAPAGWRYRPSLMGRREGGTWLVEGGWKARRQRGDYLASLLEPSPLQSVVHRLLEEQAADARRRGLL